MFIEATDQSIYIDVTWLYYYFWPTFFAQSDSRIFWKIEFLFHEDSKCTGVFKYCGVWICFSLLRYRCIFCSIRLKKLLSAHVLDLLLINIKVHTIYCACAKKFEYSTDDEITKLMPETQKNTLLMYTNCN